MTRSSHATPPPAPAANPAPVPNARAANSVHVDDAARADDSARHSATCRAPVPADGAGVRNVVIMGAAGRDFHNFNVLLRNDPAVHVVAFTAAQIPDIDGRCYPAALAGARYPDGVPILAERELTALCRDNNVHEVIFSYSDVSHETVMHAASLTLAAGADFRLLSPAATMLRADKPVVAVTAVRTGCGKSPVTRHLCAAFLARGIRPVVVRHPMPYGDLERQAVQRFASHADMDAADCTVEEREEYEHLVDAGITVFAGVDYARILAAAQTEADVLLWDGGNNDTPFFRPDVHLTVCDPLRAGHELAYHPGETNLRMCHVTVINKVETATPEQVATVRANIAAANPGARVLLADSVVEVDDPAAIRRARVLLVEDGPTLTHGGLPFGAAQAAAEMHGAGRLADPRPYARGSLKQVFEDYPHLGKALPAMGYSRRQLDDLEATINATPCDLVLLGTPVRLDRLIRIDRPWLRVRYTYRDRSDAEGGAGLAETVRELLDTRA
ncbi:cyclic 2,3-diphosphoglycerate synthase [Nitratidesulfovibrio termitidis]|uniref:cyclic 2,3-diphosphoglycerate synthase n=1 Tax=Nitratidesulfovibrio termitidis TaxID=42252 RepID=UPI00041F0FB1|nr:cyclic 2,3-diphosphoglycerate synthase [Nitratidesulfovibrio termitidis]